MFLLQSCVVYLKLRPFKNFPEYLSDVSDLEEENEDDIANASDSEMSVDDDDKKSSVSFAPESTTSEYPVEPNKYDERIDMEEESIMLQKIKGTKCETFRKKCFPPLSRVAVLGKYRNILPEVNLIECESTDHLV